MKKNWLTSTSLARLWTLVILITLGLLINLVYKGVEFQTNILDLLPDTEKDAVVESSIDIFTSHIGHKVVFLIGADSEQETLLVAQDFSTMIEESPLFSDVKLKIEENTQKAYYELYFPKREFLLSKNTLALLKDGSEGVKSVLENSKEALYSPLSGLYSRILEDDPLLLFPDYMQSLPVNSKTFTIIDGYMVVRYQDKSYALAVAQTKEEPFLPSASMAVAEFIEGAKNKLKSKYGQIEFLSSGFIRFAHAGTQSACREIFQIGLGSIIGVLLLLWITFGSMRILILSLVPILVGLITAFTFSSLIFAKLHLMTLGFGASLIGICVDYSFHYFSEVFSEKGSWNSGKTLARVFPGILLGVITSIVGFVSLAFAPFPGLQQMAVFSSFGLLGAFGTVVCWFPSATKSIVKRDRPSILAIPMWWMKCWTSLLGIPGRLGIVFILVSFFGYFAFQVELNDDIRTLQNVSTSLSKEQSRIQTIIGGVDSSRFFLVEGFDEQQVLRREERLVAKLNKEKDLGRLQGFLAISTFIPSRERQHENHSLLRKGLFGPDNLLIDYLNTLGFPKTVEDRMRDRFDAARSDYLELEDWLQSPASDTGRYLWLGENSRGVASIVMLQGVSSEMILDRIEGELEGVTYVNKVDDTSQILKIYREKSTILVLVSYCVIYLMLALRYGGGFNKKGLTKALFVIIPPVSAGIGAVGYLGLTGQPMNLFTVLALLLVLGIGIDYTLFFAEGHLDGSKTSNREVIMVANFLSALTTILSFGILSLSNTPFLYLFGQTVFVGIIIAVLLSPFALGLQSYGNSD